MDDIYLVTVCLLVIPFFAGCLAGPQGTGSDMNATLSLIESGISRELQGIDRSNAGVAEQLSGTGLTGEAAEKVLLDHFLAHPWAISSATISNDSVLVGIAPDTYRDKIGTDLSFQEETVRIVSAQAPVVSAVFPIIEGENAIVQSCPVFAPGGTYLGYVDLTYRPDVLIGRVAGPVLANTTYSAMVIQDDGYVLYSTDAGEMGRNVFSDPAYQDQEHRALFARVAAEPSGTSPYRSPGPGHENMVVAWSTAATDGVSWRVVLFGSPWRAG